MDQELLNKVHETAKRAGQVEDEGRSERTCNKYWKLHFEAVDQYKAHLGGGRCR